MMQCVLNITITQSPNTAFPNRNRAFTFNYANRVEIENTWKNLTDKASITLPRNIYIKDQNGKVVPLGTPGQPGAPNYSINIGGSLGDVVPLFLRGDVVQIQLGYIYPASQNTDGTYNYTGGPKTVYNGFISKVTSGIPVILHCEDNMWKLKQINAPNKVYPAGTNNLGALLKDLQAASGFQVVQGTPANPWNVNIGDFTIKNETWSRVLDRLRKNYHIYFYFRGNILKAGGLVYYPEDAQVVGNFGFEENIFPGDKLDYQRKEDINVGAQCYSILKVQQDKNARGVERSVDTRLQAVVYSDPSGKLIGSTTATPDKQGFTEFFTFFFDGVVSASELIQKGIIQLNRYYYEGFRGKFTTFGTPLMQHGNLANITSTIQPERNGQYIIKAVKTVFESSDTGGITQEIELHFRTDVNNILANLLQNGG